MGAAHTSEKVALHAAQQVDATFHTCSSYICSCQRSCCGSYCRCERKSSTKLECSKEAAALLLMMALCTQVHRAGIAARAVGTPCWTGSTSAYSAAAAGNGTAVEHASYRTAVGKTLSAAWLLLQNCVFKSGTSSQACLTACCKSGYQRHTVA